MILLSELNFSLPLENPVLIFSIILFIILFTPILLARLRIPQLIGLILAGALIGPNGLYIMQRGESIELFGTVGLLYIMFLAGLEIDLGDFKKNSRKSMVFGMFTFLIPMALGTLAGMYVLGFSVPTSVLLASMFASHTLIAYPIVSKLGVAKNRAVNITVGGTMITDTLALLTLAVIVGMSTGEISTQFWIRLGLSVLAFGLIVLLVFPIIGRWFFKRFDDNISQYIFVLGIVFMGAFLAEAAGIEAIIGAFLAGLALNRLIPHTSPLMNRIEFVGNALFIPFFLIGVGMLIDFASFVEDFETIFVAIVMTIVATVSKFLAAWFTQKTFKFSSIERNLIFGLSNAQAAATLAAVLVGYNIVLGESPGGEPIRLLNESVLNGTILMILVTCTIASFVTQKGAQQQAAAEAVEGADVETDIEERILIPINNIENVEELVNLSITVKSKLNRSGLYALNIIDEHHAGGVVEKNARKILNKATVVAAATDNEVQELLRYDLNIVNGINNVVREHKITDMIIGLHQQQGISDTFLGNLTEGILTKCNTTTLIYKPFQPLSTIKRYIIVVPNNAERELGFPFWLIRAWNIGKNTGAKLIFFGSNSTLAFLKEVHAKHPIEAEFHVFTDWSDFLILSREVKLDDNLMIVMSRRHYPSFNSMMAKIPNYLNRYFKENNFILVYPIQLGVDGSRDYEASNASVADSLLEGLEKLDEIGKTITGMFRRK
ncbi:cation:proton antiporter [Cesiribacter sp. SM1]|uniref:cation:proton antiporter n=1 Tax=Cesiribacter sp. SM1 TaxID=2861196 RepID=UPI001CD71057|nr:cation:proton antiporter [Cesiribacter sp. SM1]